MKEWIGCEINCLQNTRSWSSCIPQEFKMSQAGKVRKFHERIPGYRKTNLVNLANLASDLHVKGIYVKDESDRFSLNAFKGLGGSYAMFRILCEKMALDPELTTPQDLIDTIRNSGEKPIEFATCTDGNHGKGVSWAAGIFGCKAHIYMPYGTIEARVEAIRKAGPAEVVVTDLSYDDTVLYARKQSEENGWILIQDTSWKGYEQIPRWIIQGYLTMAEEAVEDFKDLHLQPTHVFLQAGVGAMAGGILACLTDYYGEKKPVTAIVEPFVADCFYKSARTDDGNPYSVGGAPVTIMAGLNCGTPCGLAWPIIRDYADFYLSCTDAVAEEGMLAYAAGAGGDPQIISGGSGAAPLGVLRKILQDQRYSEVRQAMKFDRESIIFLINTEGNTDPDNYKDIVMEKLARESR